ncbi:MAG: CRTAC1 family protein [Ferruginibacter sp.]
MLKSTLLFIAWIFFVTIFNGSCSDSGSKEKVMESPVFKKIAPSESGIDFTNIVDENYQKNYFDSFAYVYNGAGVATGDFNNDGLMDIYFTGNEVPDKLYINEGKMKFKDITASAGVAGGSGWKNGVTLIDINNDGFLDIYICKGGYRDSDSERRNFLYINQGNLTFKEEAKEYGLDDDGYSMQAAFFDMDNDNDLDLYISSRPDSFYLGLSKMVSGKRNPPEKCRNKLYRNDNGKFTEIGVQAGIGNTYGYALGIVTADLNNDGYQDIFLSNDYADNDYIFINQKDGTFKDEVKSMTNHLSLFSMGADIADLNNDGYEDILVMEMLSEDYKRSKVSMPRMDVKGFNAIVDSGFEKQYMHNMLHLNQGNGFFSDVSQMAGIAKTEWSWATLACDFDNDGNRDIFVANGYRRDLFDGDIQQRQDMYIRANMSKYNSSKEMFEKGFKEYLEIYDSIKVRNYLFKNNGGLKFQNVSEQWGFKDSTFSNGAAVADFDNDGDLDLVINNLDGVSDLYENISTKKNNYLRLKLEGPAKNNDGIGAKISIYYDGKLQQFFQQKTVRGYLSCSEPFVHFGLGDHKKLDSVVVVWPDGKSNLIANVSADQLLKVSYKEAISGLDRRTIFHPVFSESTAQLLSTPFKHVENSYNEYSDQVLLPHEFGRDGPFTASGDVNKDGQEDFFVGGAKGQAGTLYLQQNGKFVKKSIKAFEDDKKYEDMGCSFLDVDGDGDLDLYVVSGGSEFEEGSDMYQDRLYINDGAGNFSKSSSVPKTTSSGSCVAAFDFDGDGDIDIFRGGEVVAHKYPQPPLSYLMVNQGGKFIDKTNEIAPSLSRIGMVKSAVWADLNNDKKPELIIAGEWMPIKVFEFTSGKAVDVSLKYGFENTEGWWDKLVADDIDGDGNIDLIAGNLGENYKFQASIEKPFEVYAKDFDGNGTNDIFLAKHLKDIMVPIRGRECTSQQCPMIATKFPSYLSFAETDLSGILGENELKTALHYKAHLFSTVAFINNHGKFSMKELPMEAQLSTVNGIIVKDFDGDGKKDILIAGNKFDVEVETTPADASPGCFLKGLGAFEFRPFKPLESGFFVPYNVKDIELIKTVGGLGIIVSSNNDYLRIFQAHNN